MDLYDDMDISAWQQILCKGMHYHCGDFSKFDDHRAFEEPVRRIYPYIGMSKTILDVGCGWGGPAVMLRTDCNAIVTCVTPSVQQTQYCKDLGFTVHHSSIEDLLKGGSLSDQHWDIVLCFESFTHLDQEYFLEKIKPHCDTLIMLVNCSDRAHYSKSFQMTIRTAEGLRALLTKTGWTVQVFENTRKDNLSNYYWDTNIKTHGIHNSNSKHLQALNNHNRVSMARGQQWVSLNPVMLVVAHHSHSFGTKPEDSKA